MEPLEPDHLETIAVRNGNGADALARLDLLTTAFEAIPEGFVIYDPQDRLVLCNAAYRQLYAASAPAMVPGTTFEAILRYGLERGQYPAAGETRESRERWLAERLAVHRRADRQIEQRLPGGRWLSIHERRLECGHVIGFRTDITRLKRLGSERTRLSRVVERSEQEIYLLDAATSRYIEVNQGACRNLGYAREDLIGKTPADINPDYDPIAVRASLAPMIEGEVSHLDFETRHVRRDGTSYPCRVRAFYDGEGEDGGSIVAFAEDISERNELQRQVRQGRAELETLLQGIPDLVLRAKPDTTLTFVNAPFARWQGTTADALIGRRFAEILPEADRDALLADLAALTPECPVLHSTQTMVDRAGVERVYQWSHTMSFHDGVPDALLSVGREVTEIFAANQALAKANAELESFAYAASHDLRSPIQTMRSLLGVLEEDCLAEMPPDARMVLDRLTGVSDRMLQLSNGVLDYARVAGMPPETDVFDVRELLDGIVGNLEAEIAESGARIEIGPMPALVASRQQIGQVFQNLIANALKFRRDGIAPDVFITATATEERHVFAVADRGIGIDGKDASDIFSPFRRLHGQSAYTGSGLGLTICRRIVELHGGEIAALPREGGGTIFRFSLRKDRHAR